MTSQRHYSWTDCLQHVFLFPYYELEMKNNTWQVAYTKHIHNQPTIFPHLGNWPPLENWWAVIYHEDPVRLVDITYHRILGSFTVFRALVINALDWVRSSNLRRPLNGFTFALPTFRQLYLSPILNNGKYWAQIQTPGCYRQISDNKKPNKNTRSLKRTNHLTLNNHVYNQNTNRSTNIGVTVTY